MSQAASGHGVTIAKEMNPVSAPGVFTVVGEVMGDVKWPPESRTKTDVTPHTDNSDSYVFSYWIRGPLGFGINYLYANSTHGFGTGGIQGDLANTSPGSGGVRAGWRITGPRQTPGAGVDEWIFSGNVETFARTSKNKAEDSATVTVQPSGPWMVNGVQYG